MTVKNGTGNHLKRLLPNLNIYLVALTIFCLIYVVLFDLVIPVSATRDNKVLIN